MKSNEILTQMSNLGFTSKASIEHMLKNKHYMSYGTFEIHDDLSISIHGNFSIYNENFKQLPFRLKFVQGYFIVRSCNNLISLEGFPLITQSNVSILNNLQLTSFHNIHKHMKRIGGDGIFDCGNATHLLGLCAIKGIRTIGHFNDEVASIMNDNLHDMIICQQALIDAGFPQHAKL